MSTMQRAFGIAFAMLVLCFVTVSAADDVQTAGLIRNAGQWPNNVVAYSHIRGVDVWVTRNGVVVDEYLVSDGIRTGNVVEEYFVGASVVDVPAPAGSTSVSFFTNGSHTPILTTASRADVIPFRFPSGAVVNVSVAADGRIVRSLREGDESLANSVTYLRKGDVNKNQTMDATKAQSFVYGSYLGGAQFDAITNMEMMPNGNVLVAGTTRELAFPTGLGGYSKTIKADHDAFVLICDAKFQTIKAMSFLGGSGVDRTRSLARDDQNNIYLAIETNSTDMPATPSAQSKTNKGGYDAFVARFDSTLTKLLAGFYHGGNRDDSPRSITVDQTGLIYLAGGTMSTSGMPNNMTPTASLTWTYQEGMNTKTTTVVISAGNTNMGQMDGFVAIYSPSGSMQKSRYYGNTGNDIITNVAVDSRGYIVVTGSTTSTTFEAIPAAHPTWSGRLPYRKTFGGGTTDAFIAKMSSGLNFSQSDGVTFATLFGGNKEEEPVSLWLDDAGKIFVAGNTTSTNLPTSGSVYPTALGKQDGFVIQMADNGTSLLNGTYIGGAGDDVVRNVRPSQRTSAFLVCGATTSMDFPIEGVGAMSERFGPTDGFFTMMNFGSLTLSSLLGGLQADTVADFLLDFRGDAMLAANTTSGNLRVHDSAYAKPGGGSDGYLTKYSPGILEIVTPKGGEIYCVGSSKPLSWDASGVSDTTKFRIEYSVEGSGKWSDVVKSIGGRSYLWKIPASVVAGTYRIRISTVNGHVSELTTPFTIDIPPTISKQPISATVCEGGKLMVAVTASSVAAKYQWKKDGVVIPGATAATYSVDTATSAMAGRYECVITGDCPPAVTSQPATITITAKPVITSQPVSQTLDLGKPLTLTVAATGPGLTYQWMKDGVKVDQATTATLSIASVSKSDEGSYACDVTGACGITTSSAAIIRVNNGTSVGEYSDKDLAIHLVGPSPASDVVVFAATATSEAVGRLTIIDILGSPVKVVDYRTVPTQEVRHSVDIHDLAAGVYVAEFLIGGSQVDIPFTVRR
ncbi:MAG: immunoglobulin domain-containing protein [Candidatus Kapabacteria bacterium]|nr:immunoglobulin domain-containing protein [Candidatus Kapabacteria bacterium]